MRTFESHGYSFNHNGDFSGVIYIHHGGSPRITSDFAALVGIATDTGPKSIIPFVNEVKEHVYVDREAIRNFIANASLLLVESHLEEKTAAELVADPLVKAVLKEKVKSLSKVAVPS